MAFDSHSLNNLINYTSICVKTNFTLASSARWGIEAGAVWLLHPQILMKHLLVSSNSSGRIEIVALPRLFPSWVCGEHLEVHPCS